MNVFKDNASDQLKQREIKFMDHLDGFAFEDYVAQLLQVNGYQAVHQTSKIHDNGLDILAKKQGVKYGFQCKHYKKRTVGMKAVRQTFVGKNAYQVDCAILLVNRDFDYQAVTLAKRLRIKLCDRKQLLQLMQPHIKF